MQMLNIDFQTILTIISAFFADARLYLIVLLIFLDLALGVAAALKSGQFDLAYVADFYQTNVLSYVIGYLALYITFELVASDIVQWLGDGLHWSVYTTLIAKLANSVWTHISVLKLPLERPD